MHSVWTAVKLIAFDQITQYTIYTIRTSMRYINVHLIIIIIIINSVKSSQVAFNKIMASALSYERIPKYSTIQSEKSS